MALIVDSGALVALYDTDDQFHARMVEAFKNESGALVVPVLTISEASFLIRQRVGLRGEVSLLEDLRSGPFSLEFLTDYDLRRCGELLTKYADLTLDLADAAVVAAAERHQIQRIATVDLRDFRVIRSANGKPFTLVPWDD